MIRFLLSDASKLRRKWLGSHQSFLFRNAFSLELSTNSATSSTSSTVFKPRSSRARCHQQCVYRNGCSACSAEMSRKFLWVWNESRDVLWSLPPCFLIFLSPCLLWPCTTSLFEESLCIFQSIPTSLADASQYFFLTQIQSPTRGACSFACFSTCVLHVVCTFVAKKLGLPALEIERMCHAVIKPGIWTQGCFKRQSLLGNPLCVLHTQGTHKACEYIHTQCRRSHS